MRKHLVIYNTVSGDILSIQSRSKESVLICKGSGIMSEGIVTSDVLAGVDIGSVIQLYVESVSRKHAYSHLVRVSDNSVNTGHITFHPEPIEVTVECRGLREASHYSDTEKDAYLNEITASKEEVGILRVETNLNFSPHTHCVDISAKRLIRKDDIVNYI